MRKLIKKTIALTSAIALTLSMAPLASAAPESGETDSSAAKGDITVTDQFEGYVDKNVFNVVVPTVSTVTFTLDPQGLLGIANGSTYTLGEGAVYFTNDGGTYSDTSDPIAVTNQSSYDVNANLKLTLTNEETSGITMVDSEDALASATTPSLYLGVKEGANDATALVAGDNSATKKLVKVDEDQDGGSAGNGYYVKVASGGSSPLGGNTYTYELGTGFTASAEQKASFTLTGACDSTSDWSDIDMENLTVEIAWDITDASVAADDFKLALNDNGTMSYKFASAPTGSITSITINGTDRMGGVNSGVITYSAGVFSIASTQVTNWGISTQATTVVMTIGGEDITLTYTP